MSKFDDPEELESWWATFLEIKPKEERQMTLSLTQGQTRIESYVVSEI